MCIRDSPVTDGARRCLTWWCESAVSCVGMREPLVRFNKWYHTLTDEQILSLGDKFRELDWLKMQIMRNHVHYRD